jgi:hypothetical protein
LNFFALAKGLFIGFLQKAGARFVARKQIKNITKSKGFGIEQNRVKEQFLQSFLYCLRLIMPDCKSGN